MPQPDGLERVPDPIPAAMRLDALRNPPRKAADATDGNPTGVRPDRTAHEGTLQFKCLTEDAGAAA